MDRYEELITRAFNAVKGEYPGIKRFIVFNLPEELLSYKLFFTGINKENKIIELNYIIDYIPLWNLIGVQHPNDLYDKLVILFREEILKGGDFK